jgi:hypothetical protein
MRQQRFAEAKLFSGKTELASAPAVASGGAAAALPREPVPARCGWPDKPWLGRCLPARLGPVHPGSQGDGAFQPGRGSRPGAKAQKKKREMTHKGLGLCALA